MAVEITNLSTLTPTSITVDETGQTITIASTTTAVEINSGTVNYTISAGGITFVGDDSTGTKVSDNETFKIAGTGGITTSVSGDILTVDGSAITAASAQGITFVGDDSTGTRISDNETVKIAGGTGITTAMSGDTLTITGPNLSSYLTNSQITVVGDDSTGTTLNTGETIKIAGTSNITTAVSGDTLTITGPNLTSFITASSTDTLTNKTFNANGTGNSISNIEVADLAAGVLDTDLAAVSASDDTVPSAKAVKAYIDAQNTAQALTFVGDDSTGTAVNSGETFKIAGTQNITTAVSGDTLTITGPDLTSFATASSTTTFTNKSGNISQWTNNSGYLTNSPLTVVGDDSTGATLNTGETIKIAGGTGITTAVSGDVLTITATGGASAQGITVVGDDSTGTIISDGETVKIAGGNNITTAMSGDTLTITGSKTIDVNEINSGDSSAIQINDAVNVSGATTINNTLAVISTSTFTGDATFLGSITGGTNSPITIAPDGTGDVHLNADSVRIGDNNADATIATRGTGDLILTTNEGSGTEGTIRLYDGANGNIELATNGTGDVHLTADTVRVGDVNATATITTNGTGVLVLNTNAGTNSSSIQIAPNNNGNISLIANGTGKVILGPTNGDSTLEAYFGSLMIKSANNGNIELQPGTNDINLTTDRVRLGRANIDCSIVSNGTGDLTLKTNDASGDQGSIKIAEGANGLITIATHGEGNIDLVKPFNSTYFPYNPAEDNANWIGASSSTYRGARTLYSNLAQGAITSNDERVRANLRMIVIKHPNDSTVYGDNDYVIQNTDLTMVDINGQNFAQTSRGAGARGEANNIIMLNTAGGTKQGPNLAGGSAFVEIPEGHGGDLTCVNAMGFRSFISNRADTGEFTRITNAFGFLAEGVGTGGTGANGTNRFCTNEYGFFSQGATGTSLTTNYYGFYANTGANATNKYAFYSANDDYISRLGTIERAKDKVNALTAGATVSVDTDLAPIHTITLAQNTTFSFTNLSTGQSVCLIIRQDATGSRTGTFTGVVFAGGTPTLSTAANAIDVVRIVRDGTSNLGIIDKAFA